MASYVPQYAQHEHATADMSSYTAHVGICTSSGTSSDPQGLDSSIKDTLAVVGVGTAIQAVVAYLFMRPSSVATANAMATAYAGWADGFTTS